MPQSLSMNAAFGGAPSASVQSIAGSTAQPNKDRKMASAEQLVLDLSNPELRENALLELSKVNLPGIALSFSLEAGLRLRLCVDKLWLLYNLHLLLRSDRTAISDSGQHIFVYVWSKSGFWVKNGQTHEDNDTVCIELKGGGRVGTVSL